MGGFKLRYNKQEGGAPPPLRLLPFPNQHDTTTRDAIAQERLAQFPLQNEVLQLRALKTQSDLAKARHDLRNEIETERQKAAFYDGFEELKSALDQRGFVVGTREHAQAVATFASHFPLARSTKDIHEDLKMHSVVNDDQARLKAGLIALSAPPEKIAQRHAYVTGTLAQKEAELKGDIARQATANKGTPNVPYNPAFDADAAKIAGDLEAAKVEKAGLEKNYPQLVAPVSPTQQALAPQTTAVADQPAADITAPTTEAAPTEAVPEATPTPTAQPSATPSQQSTFPPVGETRVVGGKSYVSTGKRWEPQ